MQQPTKVKIDYDINLNNAEFKKVIDNIVKDNEFDEIIETGTYNGLGSTSIFAKTDKYVFSIECNFNNFVNASRNLAKFDNVCVVHGLSLNRNDIIKSLLEEDFDSDTTYDSKFPKSFYMREVSQQVVVENALEVFCKNKRKQLVFLDSAGGIGYLEYKSFMSMGDEYLKNKILVLDDINHIKHERSVQDLLLRGYEVNKSSDNRFAWCFLNQQIF